MNARIILVCLCLALAMTSGRMGGYTDVPLSQLSSLQEDQQQTYRDVEAFARQKLAEKSYFQGKQLGKVTRIEYQVVAGMNYRFTFVNSNNEIVTATVFDQPWNKIRSLTHITTAAEEM